MYSIYRKKEVEYVKDHEEFDLYSCPIINLKLLEQYGQGACFVNDDWVTKVSQKQEDEPTFHEFTFLVDIKMEIWERNWITINATSFEEAKNKIMLSAYDFESNEPELLYNTLTNYGNGDGLNMRILTEDEELIYKE